MRVFLRETIRRLVTPPIAKAKKANPECNLKGKLESVSLERMFEMALIVITIGYAILIIQLLGNNHYSSARRSPLVFLGGKGHQLWLTFHFVACKGRDADVCGVRGCVCAGEPEWSVESVTINYYNISH
jgi:hypothetical protein